MLNHGCTYFDRVGPGGAGDTLASFYAARYPHSAESVWRTRAAAGEISRNGRPAGPDETLAAGDRLQWRRPPWEEPDVPTDWRVVFEDAHLLAVDKPAGLPGACGYFFRAASLRIPHPATGEPLVLSVPEER